ncbi:MAG: tetraacyldisaccharide 4'-kinase, partial [Bacteroidota bacterium]
VPVVVAERRIAAAQVAARRLGAEVIVADDCFQHRHLARDLDIVLVDVSRPPDAGMLVPFGPLREPPDSLGRADLVGLSRADTPAAADRALQSVRRWYGGPVFAFRLVHDGMISSGGGPAGPGAGRTVYAFSGIGSHGQFVASLEREGYEVRGHRRYRDHRRYRLRDLLRLEKERAEAGAERLVTTEKDYVRLEGEGDAIGRLLRELPLDAARVRVQLVMGEDAVQTALENILEESPLPGAPGDGRRKANHTPIT